MLMKYLTVSDTLRYTLRYIINQRLCIFGLHGAIQMLLLLLLLIIKCESMQPTSYAWHETW